MYAKGRKSSTVRNTYSILCRGLALAKQRGKVDANVAKDMDPPGTPTPRSRKALSLDQVRAVLAVIEKADDRLRWRLAFAIGPRQCETLGMRWQYTDLDDGVVDLSWQVSRQTWRHGCGDPAGCRKRAQDCPARTGGGMVFTRPKTYRDESDQHLVALPPSIVAELRAHRKVQAAQRLRVGSRWVDHDLVFCGPFGQILDPRHDLTRWKAILKAAGLADAGTHAMRSTAATLLFEKGERIEVVQEMLGHTNARTTRGYTEVSVGLTRRAAEAMDDLFAPVIDINTRKKEATG